MREPSLNMSDYLPLFMVGKASLCLPKRQSPKQECRHRLNNKASMLKTTLCTLDSHRQTLENVVTVSASNGFTS